MNYREIRPSVLLSPYIKCYWALENEGEPGSQGAQKVLPDGCSEMIFNYGFPFKQHNQAGAETQPVCLLVGQMKRYLMIEPTGPTGLVAVRFLPGGAYPFFDFPQHELTDRIISLDSAWGRLARDIQNEIEESRTCEERIAVITRVLTMRLMRNENRDSAVEAAVETIMQRQGLVKIDSLASTVGMSERQLERRFSRRVGVSPKVLCRIVRFQRILRRLEHGPACNSWAQLASECGYYDQAHFVHEFNQFSGQDPTSFLAERYEMTHHFTGSGHDELSDFYNTQ